MRGLLQLAFVTGAAALRPAALGAEGNRPAYAAAPLVLDTTTLQFTLDGAMPIGTDFDAFNVDLTQYGVPWSSYLYEEPLPVSWEGRLANATAAAAAYRMPVVLTLPILGSDKRSCPAKNASDYPGTSSPVVNDFAMCTQCFDFDIVRNPTASFIRQAWINYATTVALAFNATGTLAVINFGVDINRFLESGCPAEQWDAMVGFANQAYYTIKTAFPEKAVFPSVALETVMQVQDGQACKGLVDFRAAKPSSLFKACVAGGYGQLKGLVRDAFAFSANPALGAADSGGWQPWYVNYPVSILNATDGANIVVASTGYFSTPVMVNWNNGSMPLPLASAPAAAAVADPAPQCITIIPSNATYATSWFETVVAAVPSAWIITIATARDTLPDFAMQCPCSSPLPVLQPYCDGLTAYRNACNAAGLPAAACEIAVKSMGTLGVRDVFGQPREPLFTALQDARTAPLLL